MVCFKFVIILRIDFCKFRDYFLNVQVFTYLHEIFLRIENNERRKQPHQLTTQETTLLYTINYQNN